MLALLLAMLAGDLLTGPWLWENLETCDLTRPIPQRCREVRGVFGGVIDARVHEPAW